MRAMYNKLRKKKFNLEFFIIILLFCNAGHILSFNESDTLIQTLDNPLFSNNVSYTYNSSLWEKTISFQYIPSSSEFHTISLVFSTKGDKSSSDGISVRLWFGNDEISFLISRVYQDGINHSLTQVLILSEVSAQINCTMVISGKTAYASQEGALTIYATSNGKTISIPSFSGEIIELSGYPAEFVLVGNMMTHTSAESIILVNNSNNEESLNFTLSFSSSEFSALVSNVQMLSLDEVIFESSFKSGNNCFSFYCDLHEGINILHFKFFLGNSMDIVEIKDILVSIHIVQELPTSIPDSAIDSVYWKNGIIDHVFNLTHLKPLSTTSAVKIHFKISYSFWGDILNPLIYTVKADDLILFTHSIETEDQSENIQFLFFDTFITNYNSQIYLYINGIGEGTGYIFLHNCSRISIDPIASYGYNSFEKPLATNISLQTSKYHKSSISFYDVIYFNYQDSAFFDLSFFLSYHLFTDYSLPYLSLNYFIDGKEGYIRLNTKKEIIPLEINFELTPGYHEIRFEISLIGGGHNIIFDYVGYKFDPHKSSLDIYSLNEMGLIPLRPPLLVLYLMLLSFEALICLEIIFSRIRKIVSSYKDKIKLEKETVEQSLSTVETNTTSNEIKYSLLPIFGGMVAYFIFSYIFDRITIPSIPFLSPMWIKLILSIILSFFISERIRDVWMYIQIHKLNEESGFHAMFRLLFSKSFILIFKELFSHIIKNLKMLLHIIFFPIIIIIQEITGWIIHTKRKTIRIGTIAITFLYMTLLLAIFQPIISILHILSQEPNVSFIGIGWLGFYGFYVSLLFTLVVSRYVFRIIEGTYAEKNRMFFIKLFGQIVSVFLLFSWLMLLFYIISNTGNYNYIGTGIIPFFFFLITKMNSHLRIKILEEKQELKIEHLQKDNLYTKLKDIPYSRQVPLSTLADITKNNKTTVERFLEELVREYPSIGEYDSDAELFIRSNHSENPLHKEIEKLEKSYQEWEVFTSTDKMEEEIFTSTDKMEDFKCIENTSSDPTITSTRPSPESNLNLNQAKSNHIFQDECDDYEKYITSLPDSSNLSVISLISESDEMGIDSDLLSTKNYSSAFWFRQAYTLSNQNSFVQLMNSTTSRLNSNTFVDRRLLLSIIFSQMTFLQGYKQAISYKSNLDSSLSFKDIINTIGLQDEIRVIGNNMKKRWYDSAFIQIASMFNIELENNGNELGLGMLKGALPYFDIIVGLERHVWTINRLLENSDPYQKDYDSLCYEIWNNWREQLNYLMGTAELPFFGEKSQIGAKEFRDGVFIFKKNSKNFWEVSLAMDKLTLMHNTVSVKVENIFDYYRWCYSRLGTDFIFPNGAVEVKNRKDTSERSFRRAFRISQSFASALYHNRLRLPILDTKKRKILDLPEIRKKVALEQYYTEDDAINKIYYHLKNFITEHGLSALRRSIIHDMDYNPEYFNSLTMERYIKKLYLSAIFFDHIHQPLLRLSSLTDKHMITFKLVSKDLDNYYVDEVLVPCSYYPEVKIDDKSVLKVVLNDSEHGFKQVVKDVNNSEEKGKLLFAFSTLRGVKNSLKRDDIICFGIEQKSKIDMFYIPTDELIQRYHKIQNTKNENHCIYEDLTNLEKIAWIGENSGYGLFKDVRINGNDSAIISVRNLFQFFYVENVDDEGKTVWKKKDGIKINFESCSSEGIDIDSSWKPYKTLDGDYLLLLRKQNGSVLFKPLNINGSLIYPGSFSLRRGLNRVYMGNEKAPLNVITNVAEVMIRFLTTGQLPIFVWKKGKLVRIFLDGKTAVKELRTIKKKIVRYKASNYKEYVEEYNNYIEKLYDEGIIGQLSYEALIDKIADTINYYVELMKYAPRMVDYSNVQDDKPILCEEYNSPSPNPFFIYHYLSFQTSEEYFTKHPNKHTKTLYNHYSTFENENNKNVFRHLDGYLCAKYHNLWENGENLPVEYEINKIPVIKSIDCVLFKFLSKYDYMENFCKINDLVTMEKGKSKVINFFNSFNRNKILDTFKEISASYLHYKDGREEEYSIFDEEMEKYMEAKVKIINERINEQKETFIQEAEQKEWNVRKIKKKWRARTKKVMEKVIKEGIEKSPVLKKLWEVNMVKIKTHGSTLQLFYAKYMYSRLMYNFVKKAYEIDERAFGVAAPFRLNEFEFKVNVKLIEKYKEMFKEKNMFAKKVEEQYGKEYREIVKSALETIIKATNKTSGKEYEENYARVSFYEEEEGYSIEVIYSIMIMIGIYALYMSTHDMKQIMKEYGIEEEKKEDRFRTHFINNYTITPKKLGKENIRNQIKKDKVEVKKVELTKFTLRSKKNREFMGKLKMTIPGAVMNEEKICENVFESEIGQYTKEKCKQFKEFREFVECAKEKGYKKARKEYNQKSENPIKITRREKKRKWEKTMKL